jgi:protein-disulfide isomerase
VAPKQDFDLSLGLSAPEQVNSNVKMTIVEFADFRCPHCKHAAPTLHAFLKSNSDVRLIFKPFPLDGTCNEAIKSGGDGVSCGLAAAVLCAEKIAKKGWSAHDYIFENQSEISQARSLEKNIDGLAQHLDLNKNEINNCIKDSATMDLIRKMAKEGEIAQIQGTPAVFVNGKLLGAGHLLPVLKAAHQSIQ